MHVDWKWLAGTFGIPLLIAIGGYFVMRDDFAEAQEEIRQLKARGVIIEELKSDVRLLNQRNGHLSEQLANVQQNITTLSSKVDLKDRELFDAFIRALKLSDTHKGNSEAPKTSFRIVAEVPHSAIKELEEIRDEFTLKPSRYALEQAQVLQELKPLTEKEKTGQLTQEEAVHKGRLEDRLGFLTQQQILESIQKQPITIDCATCKRICGPLI